MYLLRKSQMRTHVVNRIVAEVEPEQAQAVYFRLVGLLLALTKNAVKTLQRKQSISRYHFFASRKDVACVY